MKRNEVENLLKDVDESQRKAIIDGIMSLHQVDVESHKEETSAKQKEIDDANTQITTLNETVKKFDGVDVEELKKKATTVETEYKEKLANKDKDFATEKLFDGLEFASKLAKNAAVVEFKEKNLPFEDGKFLGADEYINALKETDPGAFKAKEDDDDGDDFINTGGKHDNDNKATDMDQMREIMGLEVEKK